MQIILVRHAKALDKLVAAQQNLADSKRELTKKGVHDFKKFIKINRKIFRDCDEIYSSPFIRAHQTALILRKKFGFSDSIITLQQLTPEASVKECIRTITKIKQKKIVLVSHEPFLSQFLSQTLKISTDSIYFKKGGIVVLEYDDDRFILQQLRNP